MVLKKCTVSLLPLLTTCCRAFGFLWVFLWHQWKRIGGESLLAFWKQSGICGLASREGCCTNSLHGFALESTTARHGWILMTAMCSFRSCFIFILLFCISFLVPPDSETDRIVIAVPREGNWLLVLLVRNSSRNSCCPVSQKEQENPEGYKTWTY